MGKFRYIEKIGGDTGHDLPHLGVVKIVEGKLLQMGKQVGTHLGFDLGAHNMPHGGPKKIGGGVHDPQKQIERADLQDHGKGQGCEIVDARVCHIPHQKRQHQLAYRGKRGTEQVKDQNGKIFFEIWQETAHLPFFPGFFLLFHREIHSSFSFPYTVKLCHRSIEESTFSFSF